MAKKVGTNKGKKSLTKIKKFNKIHGKISKKGNFRKEKTKNKNAQKRKEEKQKQSSTRISMLKRDANKKSAKKAITGHDMMDMLDEDMLHQMKSNSVNDIKPTEATEENDGKVVRKLLPVRTAENEWVQRQIETQVEDKSGEVVKKNKKEKEEEELDLSKIHTIVQLASERRRILEKKKIHIANVALKAVKDINNTAHLAKLLSIMKEDNPLIAISVKKCTALTLLQVFQDILPGYNIIEDIKKQRLKKETFQVVKEEMTILQYYSNYLKLMEGCLDNFKADPDNAALEDLSQVILQCFGNLLVQRPSFNFSNNIINLLVPFLNHKSAKIRETVYASLSEALKKDAKGKLSLKVIQKIYQLARRTRYRMKSDVLKLFLSFRLRDLKNSDERFEIERNRDKELKRKERNIKKLAEKFAIKPSKRQKKEKKKMNKLKDKMGDIQQQSLQDHHSVEHSQILELILGIYFHILKNKPKSKLIRLVFEGLAKFAHLINIEYFSDILKTFSSYLEDRTFNLQSSLYCISTVFTILACQDEVLNLDPMKFYKHFYCNLLRIAKDPLAKDLTIALQVMDSMFIRRKKKVDGAKVLAFTKRLATLVPSLMHHGAAASCLVALRSLMVTFPINEALLDSDPDGSIGMFSPEVEEPDHAHAISTALWELHLMRRHYHSDVQRLSLNILEGSSLKGDYAYLYNFTKRSARKIYEDYEPAQLSFQPAIPLPSEHLKIKNNKLKRGSGSLEMVNLDLEFKCQEVLEEPPNKKTKLLEIDFYSCASKGSCES